MPSVVSGVSLLVATSRTHRLLSRMKAAFLLLGESTSGAAAAGPPRPPRPPPPRPPRPPAVAAPPSRAVQRPPSTVHFQRPPACTVISVESAENSRSWKGRLAAEYVRPLAEERAAASLTWSKAGARVPFAGSMSTNSAPSAVVTRYQKRSSGSQLGRTPERRTRDVVL